MSDEKSKDIAADDDLDFDLAAIGDDPSAGDEPLSEEALDFALSELDEIDALPGDPKDGLEAPVLIEPIETEQSDALPLDGLDDDQWIPTVDESTSEAMQFDTVDSDSANAQAQPVATSTNFEANQRDAPAAGKAPLWIAIAALLVALGSAASNMLQPQAESLPTIDTTEVEAMRDEVGELRSRLIAMQQEMAAASSSDSEIDQLREQIASLRATNGTAPDPALTQKIEAQADEIASLTKAIEMLNQRQTSAAQPNSTWSLHLSSFSRRSNAEAIAKKLQAANYPVQIAPTQVNGASWYRLSMYNLASRGDAEAMRNKLASQFGLANSWIEAPAE